MIAVFCAEKYPEIDKILRKRPLSKLGQEILDCVAENARAALKREREREPRCECEECDR